MKRLIHLLFLLVFIFKNAAAQLPESMNGSDIFLQMKKLQVLGSVLYIAAHPDDENTRLLAWLSKDKLYRTGYLSLTRGDGGQNLIGDEQNIELGLIRTQELLAARKVDGAEQFFSRAYDFGFSKTTDEALKIWDKQKILGDIVWIIRKFQPDIIITRFPEDKRAGHGQHSASSVLARLAFVAAADSTRFPEQFAFGVRPWRAKRIFWNNYNFGSVNTTREDQLKIEVGGYNPVIGKSYGEIAADSRSQHRSQGFGVPHSRGNTTEYFSLTGGEKADSSLMQNIDCSWNRIGGGAAIGSAISDMIGKYDMSSPENSIPALVAIYKKIKILPAGYWKEKKLNEIVSLIQACTGIWLEATVGAGYAKQGQTIPVSIHVVNRSSLPLTVTQVTLNNQDTSWNQSLQPGVNYSLIRQISLLQLPVSQPYWLVAPMSPGSYNVDDQTLIGMPDNSPSLQAVFNIVLLGETFPLRRTVMYKFTDAVRGELFEPLTIVPSVMASLDPGLLVFDQITPKEIEVRKQLKTLDSPDEGKYTIHQTHQSSLDHSSDNFGAVSLTHAPGFDVKIMGVSENIRDFLLNTTAGRDGKAYVWATRTTGDRNDTLLQCRTISYEHIPRIDYFKPAKSVLVTLNMKTIGKRIGYIEGAGDKVPDALTAMGYTVVKLNENGVTGEGLNGFDAIITGVRAYDVHDWLKKKYPVLMNYIKNGGNLIVQYNRNLGEDSTGIGPYPFGISNTRVTEEDASVRFIRPGYGVLHFPNEITSKDFDGWVQERGIYFANHIDPAYERIFGMHDAGENEQDGSLIIGSYGKGNFVYSGLVFFRELPAGIPGAYRLFANLIALGHNKDK